MKADKAVAGFAAKTSFYNSLTKKAKKNHEKRVNVA